MLDDRRVIIHVDVGEGVCTAAVGEQEAIALRVVARILRIGPDIDQATVAILTLASTNTLGDDAAAGVLPEVNHLRTRISLLEVVRDSHGVEFSDRVITFEYTAGVLPRDGGARLDLCPRELRLRPTAVTALGDEVIDTALTFLVARIPVLHGRVLHFGILLHDNLDNGSV